MVPYDQPKRSFDMIYDLLLLPESPLPDEFLVSLKKIVMLQKIEGFWG